MKSLHFYSAIAQKEHVSRRNKQLKAKGVKLIKWLALVVVVGVTVLRLFGLMG